MKPEDDGLFTIHSSDKQLILIYLHRGKQWVLLTRETAGVARGAAEGNNERSRVYKTQFPEVSVNK